MMQVFDETGLAWRLGPGFASGGEGTVHPVERRPEWCVKLYHDRPLAAARLAKLKALKGLPASLRACAALPLGMALAGRSGREPVGVFLPFVEGRDIFELYNPQGRRSHFQGATFEFLVAAALNLVRVFGVLHGAGVVIGDVNEQNIKVRPDATLAMVDCDGFQIRQGGEWLVSEVGTPMWTPPELQKGTLRGVVRTQNHDAFGLAQLVFLLLCAGRYPFAGRPLQGEVLSPEEAIARYAFAFDPAPRNPVLAPPPGTPFFEALPPEVQAFFVRAFCEGSAEPAARPGPAEWAEALERLRGALVRCNRWRAHVYWSGAKACPWCGVLEVLGKDLFPGPAVVPPVGRAGREEEAPEVLAKRLLALHFEPLSLGIPNELHVHEAVAEGGLPGAGLWMPLARGLGPLGGMVLGRMARTLHARRAQAEAKAESCRQRGTELFLKSAALAHAELGRAHELGRLFQEWVARRDAGPVEQARCRREDALRKYLEGFLLRRHAIQGLGPGRMAQLLSHNVVTAADLSAEALQGMPGFAPGLVERLLKWRQDCERGFRFSPSASGGLSSAGPSEEALSELAGLRHRARTCE